MRIRPVRTGVDQLEPRRRDKCRAPPWSFWLNSAARHPWGATQAAGGRGKCLAAAWSAYGTAQHHPLFGAFEGEIVPGRAYQSGVPHALWAATTAVYRRSTAWAVPLGCLGTKYSLEDHGGRPVPHYFFHIFIT